MRTTFACRNWTADPVDDDTLYKIIELARFAPTGGNRQGIHVIIIRDAETRAALKPLVRQAMNLYWHQSQLGESPRNTIDPSQVDQAAARSDTQDRTGSTAMLDAPVVLVVTVDLGLVASTDAHLDRVGVISGASVYPFVWNLLLAAREAGLGGVLTTAIADAEPAVQELLGIPRHHAVAALVPLGSPVKQLTKLRRNPVEDFVTINRFDGPAFTGVGSQRASG